MIVPPGPHVVSGVIRTEDGLTRTSTAQVEAAPAAPAQRPRLVVVAVGPRFEARGVPGFPFADSDASKLAAFLARHVVAPDDGLPPARPEATILNKAAAKSRDVMARFQALEKEPLKNGDLVLVAIETHLIRSGKGRVLFGADTPRAALPADGLDADALAEVLGRIAKYKCRVVVFLDGADKSTPTLGEPDVNEFVRFLRDEQGVITFVASDQGPSDEFSVKDGRAFALAIQSAIVPSGRPRTKPGAPLSLNEVDALIKENVLEMTGRKQRAGCYLPETLSGRFPFLDPRAPRPGAVGGR